MHCMMQISARVAELPGAYRYVAAPSPALLTVYYGTLLSIALGMWSPARLKWVLSLSSILLASLLLWQFRTHHAAAALTVLPLDGGMAVHLKTPNNLAPTLVDCGNINAFETVLTPFLHARGVNNLRALLLTHGDVRHMGAAPLVVDEFSPSTVGLSEVRFRSAAYRRFVGESIGDDATSDPAEPGRPATGVGSASSARRSARDPCGRGCGGAAWTHPGHGDPVPVGSGSARSANAFGATDPEQIRAEIVVTGLPGEGEPLIPDLLQQVRPELIIVGDDERPSTGGHRASCWHDSMTAAQRS